MASIAVNICAPCSKKEKKRIVLCARVRERAGNKGQRRSTLTHKKSDTLPSTVIAFESTGRYEIWSVASAFCQTFSLIVRVEIWRKVR